MFMKNGSEKISIKFSFTSKYHIIEPIKKEDIR